MATLLGGMAFDAERLAQVTQNDKPVLIYATFPRGPLAEQVGRELRAMMPWLNPKEI